HTIMAPQKRNCQRYRSSSLESFWSPCTCGQKVYLLAAFSACCALTAAKLGIENIWRRII
ncbi:hypothetical protein DPMN_077698, partial [Dreissena polymorpha]